MARANHDEIVLIVDRSGSMGKIRDDTIGTLNTFLESQRNVEGRTASLTVVLFNDKYEVLHDGVEIGDVAFDTKNYIPAGTTAFLDAIGKAIDVVGGRLENMPEDQRPEKVIVAIMTDGLENASKEYTRKQIKEKIKHQSDTYGWIFEFLGANIDVVSEAGDIGIDKTRTVSFVATPDGVRDLGKTLGARFTTYRKAK